MARLNPRKDRKSKLRSLQVKRKRSAPGKQRDVEYSALEKKQLLAALFPTYINGNLTLGDPNAGMPYDLADTFKLHTNPGASKTIFLDFDGHHSVNNSWNHDIQFPAYNTSGSSTSFSTSELIEIQIMFQNIAEDYAPFDVNVTTEDPGIAALTKSNSSDTTYGIRSIHTQATGGFGNGIGGVAFLNSFDDSIDNPCFSFNKGINVGSMTQSHEVGHTLGLSHDGLNGSSYHPGTGADSEATSWGPIMGAPFSKNVVHWSNGDYSGSTTTQDDLAIISNTTNGINYKVDEAGNTIGTSASLPLTSSTSAFGWGFITQRTDVDYWSLDVGAGQFDMTILPFQDRPNLDIEATLYDSSGSVVATSNPVDDVNASFSIPNIAAGTYYVKIDGVGKSGRYSDYGSVGFYTIDATFEEVQNSIQIGESGFAAVNHEWQTINLTQSYTDPVVIAGPLSEEGGQPSLVRVRNITSTSFEIRLQEWDYLDQVHSLESVGYFVIEAGSWTLDNGTRIEAGNGSANTGWSTGTFGTPFSSPPVILTTTTSEAGSSAVTNRVRSVTTDDFKYKLREEEANNNLHVVESVSWLAISTGTGTTGGTLFEVAQTGTTVSHVAYTHNWTATFAETPVVLAGIVSHVGGDPTALRSKFSTATQYQVFLEEEQSFDTEVKHDKESIGLFALGAGSFSYNPPNAPMVYEPTPFTQVSTDPAVIKQALYEIEMRGEDSMPLNHCLDGGGCCCDGCLDGMAAALSSDAGLAASLLKTSTQSEVFTDDFVQNFDAAPDAGDNELALAGNVSIKGDRVVFGNHQFVKTDAGSVQSDLLANDMGLKDLKIIG